MKFSKIAAIALGLGAVVADPHPEPTGTTDPHHHEDTTGELQHPYEQNHDIQQKADKVSAEISSRTDAQIDKLKDIKDKVMVFLGQVGDLRMKADASEGKMNTEFDARFEGLEMPDGTIDKLYHLDANVMNFRDELRVDFKKAAKDVKDVQDLIDYIKKEQIPELDNGVDREFLDVDYQTDMADVRIEALRQMIKQMTGRDMTRFDALDNQNGEALDDIGRLQSNLMNYNERVQAKFDQVLLLCADLMHNFEHRMEAIQHCSCDDNPHGHGPFDSVTAPQEAAMDHLTGHGTGHTHHTHGDAWAPQPHEHRENIWGTL